MPTLNTERVDFRATKDIKHLIEQAAAISGMDVSAYIRATVIPAALEIVEGHESRVLTNRDRDTFLQLLDKSAPPHEKLTAAANRFRSDIEQSNVKV